MRNEQNVPEIRFEKYEAEWSKSDLGELIGVGSAARVHKEQWTEQGVPFYRTSDVVSIYKDQANTQAFISHELYKLLSGKIGKIQRGDLLITGGGSIGIPFLVKNDDPLYFKDADLLWLKNNNKMDGYFLYTFFASSPFRNYLKSISHIGTIGHYTISQAKATPISYCDREEQSDIGNYFQKLDTLINQHQQKHDKLSNLKKAMLEKMFPKAGETVPEIRFEGFSEDWDETPFSETFSFLSSNTLSRAELNYEHGKARNIHYGDILVKFGNVVDAQEANVPYITSGELVIKMSATKLQDGDVLFADAAEDEIVGKCVEVTNVGEEIVFSGLHTIATRPNQAFAASYLGYYFNSDSFHQQLVPLMQGTKVLSISKKSISSVGVKYPSDKLEQEEIGKYFHKLDALINQHNQQITKLKNIKQACLDKMFV
jgi:type I restriction enzyme S subunit